MNRRGMLSRTAMALGGLGLVPGMQAASHPLAPKPPHFLPRAKNVIMFFLSGGMSHLDSFDPKPASSFEGKGNLMPPRWAHRPRGQSGLEITDLFPKIAERADDLCLVRSMHGDHNCHYQATLGMHTGSVTFPRPSIGAWVSYGLGTENPNLPSHVVIADEAPYGGALVWDANFLPAYHQGVRIKPGEDPIPHLKPGDSFGPLQDMELALMRHLNEKHRSVRYDDLSLPARMLAFKTAFGLQNTAPEVLNTRGENPATLKLYGAEDGKGFGWQCLLARRLVERGVRFVELFDIGSHDNWDAHGNIMTHGPLANKIDQPIAALIQDLKALGMLEETLLVFTTEFGRTPNSEGKGRSHYNRAFTCWLAGGGVKGGFAYGKTDATASRIEENPVHVHDFHATILHLLGMDHEKLTYRQAGRDFRLTDIHGEVVHGLMS